MIDNYGCVSYYSQFTTRIKEFITGTKMTVIKNSFLLKKNIIHQSFCELTEATVPSLAMFCCKN